MLVSQGRQSLRRRHQPAARLSGVQRGRQNAARCIRAEFLADPPAERVHRLGGLVQCVVLFVLFWHYFKGEPDLMWAVALQLFALTLFLMAKK